MDETLLEKRLAQDIQVIRDRLGRMAKMVIKQLEDAMAAFATRNSRLAYAVVLRDHNIDMAEDHLDRLCQEFLVRHMPVAEQLRFIVAVAKVNSELERIGDYAVAIARRAVAVAEAEEIPQKAPILEMSTAAFEMLRRAVDAFLASQEAEAVATLDSDKCVDRMNRKVFDALAHPENGHQDLMVRFALIGVINRIERVADRACNIAEEAVYVASGQVLRHLPREDIRVLFICDHNGCRSQMAEGVARAVSPSHFVFASAGAEPTQLDQRAVAFLARHGIDISRQKAKSLSAVGTISDFNIVVTLSQGAEEARPTTPYNAVVLNWDLPDPSKTTGTEEEVGHAYAAVYEKLRAWIEDLTSGLSSAFEEEGKSP